MPQAEPTQLGVPFATEQTLPQPLQLLTSVALFTSQPLLATLSQLAKVPVQAPTAHEAATQIDIACGSAQALPHMPQLRTSVASFLQPAPPQQIIPGPAPGQSTRLSSEVRSQSSSTPLQVSAALGWILLFASL